MHARRHREAGLTILEIMIVIAIIGMGGFLVRGGIRVLTKAALSEDSAAVVGLLKRASQLAVETGELHRVTFDLDQHVFVVEVCQGTTSIVRNEKVRVDEEAAKDAIERGTQKLRELPPDALATGDAEEATRRATAVAGHHIADRMCAPTEGYTGDTSGQGFKRMLRVPQGVKFKEIWVQHLDDSVTKEQVAIYFFPTGAAEKAVIAITDGDATFSILVHGLTGRVELRGGELRDVDDHMMKNALGDKDAERENK